MEGILKFDYYYGIEAEQYSFYRVPRLLIKDRRFKGLSSDAKLLYGLMLDRMSLSVKNGWFDQENRAYIYYTVENIMEDLGCARATCTKIMAELDTKKGIGLIEKKRQGLGKPDIIYVKNFVMLEEKIDSQNKEESPSDADVSTEVQKMNFQKFKSQTSRSSEIEFLGEQKTEVQKFNFYTSGDSENESLEFQKLNPNYNNNNYTEINYTDSIYPSVKTGESDKEGGEIDEANACMKMIKENIEYEHYMKYENWQNKQLYQELFELICDVACVRRRGVKIGGENYPYELVKARFMKLNSSHLEYVIDCMRNTTTKIRNIKAYLITALYNASSTINNYYQQKVQEDMYSVLGVGCGAV